MDFGGRDFNFWVAVIGAILAQILMSERHSVLRAVTSISASVFVAWTYTDPTLKALSLDPDYESAVAGLLALTSQTMLRFVMSLSPERLLDLLRRLK